jgi:hypothetical protein
MTLDLKIFAVAVMCFGVLKDRTLSVTFVCNTEYIVHPASPKLKISRARHVVISVLLKHYLPRWAHSSSGGWLSHTALEGASAT